jgi:hypothetical protein
MAKLLGLTDAALRTRIQRKLNLPEFKRKGSRITWTQESYQEWRDLNQPQEPTNEQPEDN